jgi:hypothetical protein
MILPARQIYRAGVAVNILTGFFIGIHGFETSFGWLPYQFSNAL